MYSALYLGQPHQNNKGYLCFYGKRYQLLFWLNLGPRVVGRCDHLLSDILLIGICTYLVGGSDYQDMVVFAQERGESLGSLLKLPNGKALFSFVRMICSICFELLPLLRT